MTHLKASNKVRLDNHPVQVCEISIGGTKIQSFREKYELVTLPQVTSMTRQTSQFGCGLRGSTCFPFRLRQYARVPMLAPLESTTIGALIACARNSRANPPIARAGRSLSASVLTQGISPYLSSMKKARRTFVSEAPSPPPTAAP